MENRECLRKTADVPIGMLFALPDCMDRHNRRTLILLGDSIFDNSAYVGRGRSVPDHLERLTDPDTTVVPLARDGARTGDAYAQSERIPSDATHLILSVGGNDALSHIGFLSGSAETVSEVLIRLHALKADFEFAYRTFVKRLVSFGKPLAVCTVYNSNYADTAFKAAADTALTVWNDVIIRASFEYGTALVDLRRICTEPSDYANAIEPSDAGGAKIARALLEAVNGSR